MPEGMIVGMVCGSAIGWAVPAFFRHTIGTRYRTEDACHSCETRKAVDQIRTLVVELAIKAGVPAHEVAKLAQRTLQSGK